MDLSSHGIVSLVRNSQGQFLLLEDSREEMKGCWAPPHGRCENSDVYEETSVVRETLEETGLKVTPVKKLLTQAADTKVKSVSFWLVDWTEGELNIDPSESSESGWFTIPEASKLKLYPGTKIFFDKVMKGDIEL